MKRRTTSWLFAIATGGPAAVLAGPTDETVSPVMIPVMGMLPVAPAVGPVVQPRVLPSGAPACGNVMTFKQPQTAECRDRGTQGREIVGGGAYKPVVDDGLDDHPLTPREARRPGSSRRRSR